MYLFLYFPVNKYIFLNNESAHCQFAGLKLITEMKHWMTYFEQDTVLQEFFKYPRQHEKEFSLDIL